MVRSVNELESRLARAELGLARIAERYSLATEAARVGVWDWDLRTNEFFLDPNIKGFLGYRDDEIPDDIEVWATYIHPDDAEAVMKAAQDVIDGRSREYVFEHRMLHKDGSVRWIMVRGKVIRDERGRAIRFVGTDTDITERRELERQVRESSNRLQTRIAGDLHETLGRRLTDLLLKIFHAEAAISRKESSAAQHLREARGLAEHALALSGSLARGLSPVLADGRGMASSLGHLAAHARDFYGVDCRAELPDGFPEALSHGGNDIYRIVQEAMMVAIKLGRASSIDIEGRTFQHRFLVNISDDGAGPDSYTESAETEFQIMKYRARHLGGNVTISQRRGGGTLIVCSFPVPGAGTAQDGP